MNLLLVEDHQLFRDGLKLLLRSLHESITFFEARSTEEAERLLDQHTPDLLLMDYHLPHQEGLRRLRLKAPTAMIVVLSGEEDVALIHSVIEQGAAGFIPKNSTHAVMIAALKLVMAGGVYLPPCMFATGASRQARSSSAVSQRFLSLSPRQLQIVNEVILGKPNKIIARELDIAEATVKAHLSGAYRLLGVKNRTEAVLIAAERLGSE